jgi:hypothetical protein
VAGRLGSGLLNMPKDELDRFERDLKMLRIEFEKYFNGALDVPPTDMRTKLEQRLRLLRATVRGSADQFRLSTLEARFNSYNELFNRRLRDFEEGRGTAARRVNERQQTFDVKQGIVFGAKVEEGAVVALYSSLYGSAEESRRVDFKGFRDYLDKQAAMIRKKTGCAQVQFRLADQDGKLKLKAKPIRD